MLCFSLEAIDITAFFARCAMSRIEPFAVGFASADLASAGFTSAARAGGGTLSATCVGGCAASFAFGASASLGASTFFDTSASFGASTGLAASSDGELSATLDGSPCGAAAANLSLNIIEGEAVSGFDSAGGGGSEANTSLNEGVAGRAATETGRLTMGASNSALLTEG